MNKKYIFIIPIVMLILGLYLGGYLKAIYTIPNEINVGNIVEFSYWPDADCNKVLGDNYAGVTVKWVYTNYLEKVRYDSYTGDGIRAGCAGAYCNKIFLKALKTGTFTQEVDIIKNGVVKCTDSKTVTIKGESIPLCAQLDQPCGEWKYIGLPIPIFSPTTICCADLECVPIPFTDGRCKRSVEFECELRADNKCEGDVLLSCDISSHKFVRVGCYKTDKECRVENGQAGCYEKTVCKHNWQKYKEGKCIDGKKIVTFEDLNDCPFILPYIQIVPCEEDEPCPDDCLDMCMGKTLMTNGICSRGVCVYDEEYCDYGCDETNLVCEDKPVEDECNNLWWFDSTKNTCGYKEFCGTYMYQGLETFGTKSECEDALDDEIEDRKCPEPGEWSECYGGFKGRTIWAFNEDTGYCQKDAESVVCDSREKCTDAQMDIGRQCNESIWQNYPICIWDNSECDFWNELIEFMGPGLFYAVIVVIIIVGSVIVIAIYNRRRK